MKDFLAGTRHSHCDCNCTVFDRPVHCVCQTPIAPSPSPGLARNVRQVGVGVSTRETARDVGMATLMTQQTAQMYSRGGSPATEHDYLNWSSEDEGEVEEAGDDPMSPVRARFAVPAAPHPTPVRPFIPGHVRNSTPHSLLLLDYSPGMTEGVRHKLAEFHRFYHLSMLNRQLTSLDEWRTPNRLWRRLPLDSYPREWRIIDWTTPSRGNIIWSQCFPGLVPDQRALLCLLWRSQEIKQIFGKTPEAKNEPFLEPAELVNLILEAIGVPKDHRWEPMRRKTRNLLSKRERAATEVVLGKGANAGWHDKWDEELAQHRQRVGNELMEKSGRPFLTDADEKVLQHSVDTRAGTLRAGKNGPAIALFGSFKLSADDVMEIRRAVAALRIEVL